MLSSYQSRDFGYDPAISTEQFLAVNAERQGAFRHDLPPSSRKNGKKYVDAQAAVAGLGKAEKPALTESPWSYK
jgi:hypothetical protein